MSITPHDALFKGIFSEPRRTAELLRLALPPAVARLIDFTTFKQETSSFTDAALAQRHTDLLFSARALACDLELSVLLEHQSRDERRMPLRVLDYMAFSWRASAGPRLLPILAVVVHHSAAGWRSAIDFESLFGPDLPPEFLEYLPRFRFVLLDLGTLSDDALMQADLSPTSRLALSALKHARDTADLAPLATAWTQLVREVLGEPDSVRALAQIFRYLSLVRGRGDIPFLEQIADPAVAEAKMQTIAEYYEEKYMQQGLEKGLEKGLATGLATGLAKGRAEGEQKLLLRQLRYRFGDLPASTLEKITAADEPLLERWAERLLGARTLDEVFG